MKAIRPVRESSIAPLICVILAACGGSASNITGPSEPEPTVSPPSGPTDPTALASGSFLLLAAGAFGEPGFHEALRITAALPDTLGPTTGLTLVLELRDLSRPDVTCAAPHPTSGCATGDWDDFPGRPATPESGLFLNRLRVVAEGRARDFFLRKTLTLADDPEPGPPT